MPFADGTVLVNKIDTKWMPSVVCDCRMPIKLKGKFYKIAIKPIMFHDTKCWAIKRPSIHKMSVVEI